MTKRPKQMPNEQGRELIARLRLLRERAGLTQEQAANALGGSRYQISRIEDCRVPGYEELLAMLDVYEPDGEERSALVTLWELAWQAGRRRIVRQRLRRPGTS